MTEENYIKYDANHLKPLQAEIMRFFTRLCNNNPLNFEPRKSRKLFVPQIVLLIIIPNFFYMENIFINMIAPRRPLRLPEVMYVISKMSVLNKSTPQNAAMMLLMAYSGARTVSVAGTLTHTHTHIYIYIEIFEIPFF